MKVLIDSSVWIDHLRGVRTRETAILGALLAWLDPEGNLGDRGTPADLLIGDLVLCEVLRGIPDPREYVAVKDVLLSFEVVTAAPNLRSRPPITPAHCVGSASPCARRSIC